MTRDRVCSEVMLPGIPAALFMAVTQKLLKAGSSSDRLMKRMTAGHYRTRRLQWMIERSAEMMIEKITRGAVKDVRSFRGERERSHDIPVMAIRWRALKESIL